MPNYYFDIETTGLNPKIDKIITIQYQKLDRFSGRAIGPLTILKEWKSNEKKILEEFIKNSQSDAEYEFNFVPIGYNLAFEHNFLKEKTRKYDLPTIDILNKPFIDLRSLGILMNKGKFRRSGLADITGKMFDGKKVPTWYENKEYDKIVAYVTGKAKAFVDLNEWLYLKMSNFLEKYQQERKITI